MSALLVFAWLALAVQAASCPGGCRCPGDAALRCANVTGAELAPLLDYARRTNATRVSLAGAAVPAARNLSIAGLDALRSLDLSRGRLADLPLFNLSQLETLDLSRNVVRAVRGAPFRTMCALRVLNLSGNAMDSVSVDAFRGLRALRTLDLSQNELAHLADRLLVPLVMLHHLNLSANRLERLSERCFGALLHLQQLDVSANRLTHVSPGTLQALPSLSRLLLAGNPALGGAIKEAALLVATGRRLQTVDASRTGLTHVPAALTHSVRTLRLAGNAIAAVRCGDLDSYPLLQLLDLTANRLQDIEEDALGRLEMLAVLYLTDNKLRAIPRSLPDGLQILHLESNQIEQIVSGDLLGLPKLEVLLLNDNQIKVVQEGAFSQLSALVTLDLSRNPISILPAGTLAGPARLQMLRLADLAVEPPAEDMAFPVQSPEHLVRLDLSNSAGLARQLLADSAALAAFRDLQELNLVNTGLTNIRSDLLHFMPQLRDFHLIGNRLNCTGLLWLALWMRRQDQPEYRKVSCSMPPDLYGTLVVDLQDTDVRADVYQLLTTAVMERAILADLNDAANRTIISGTETYANGTTDTADTDAGDGASTQEPTTATSSGTGTNRSATAAPATDQLHSSPTIGTHESNGNSTNITDTVTDSDSDTVSASASASTSTSSSDGDAAEPAVEQSTHATDESRVTMDAAEPLTGAMYSSERRGAALRQPGLLAMMGAAVAAGVLLSTVVSHVRRRRKRAADSAGYNRHQDIEVNSLASMNELW